MTIVPGHAPYRLIKPYADTLTDAQQTEVGDRISGALKQYPEISEYTVTVGRMPPSVETRGDPLAKAHPYNMLILLPTGEIPRNMTIFHELAHLEIFKRYADGEDISRTSENFTSLYALARMKPEDITEEYIPYFGTPDAPQREWPWIARRALQYREENGKHSHYVKYAKELFAGRYKEEKNRDLQEYTA